MGILLDVIVVAIIILSTFLGYKKGLINVIFNICAFLVAIIITFILYKPVTNLVIQNTEIDEKIENVIIEKGLSLDNEDGEKSILSEYIEKYVKGTEEDAIVSAASIISEKIVGIIVGIALFLVIRILLILAKVLANGLAEMPFVKQFNELGGALYGVLRGIIVIYVILVILFLIVSINNTGNIVNAIDSSMLTKILYANNIILKVLF